MALPYLFTPSNVFTNNVISQGSVGSGPWTLGNLSRAQTNQYTAGTFSKFCLLLTANSGTSSITANFRVNGVSVNQALSIGTGATGFFQDTVNTDTIASGDTISCQFGQASGTVNYRVSAGSILFDDGSGNPPNHYFTKGALSASAASTSYYQCLSGVIPSALQPTESLAQTKMLVGGTIAGMAVLVSSNSRTTNCTIKFRKNGADGNSSVTYGSNATGRLTDYSNTETIAVNDLVNSVITTSTGSGTFQIDSIAYDYTSATPGKTMYMAANPGVGTSAQNATLYRQISGTPSVQTTVESNVAIVMMEPCTLSNMQHNVSANSIAATTTITMRVNGASGNQTVSIGSTATGLFEDTTNTDIVTGTDLVCYEIVTGASGANTITIPNSLVVAQFAAAPGSDGVFSPSSSLTAVGQTLRVGDATISPSVSLNADGVATRYSVLSAAANSDLSTIGAAQADSVLSISAMAALLATADALYEAVGSFIAQASMAVQGATNFSVLANFTPSAGLSADGESDAAGAAAMTAQSLMEAIGASSALGAANISAGAVLNVIGTGIAYRAVSFSAASAMAAQGRSTAEAAAEFACTVELEATGITYRFGAATFTAQAVLQARAIRNTVTPKVRTFYPPPLERVLPGL